MISSSYGELNKTLLWDASPSATNESITIFYKIYIGTNSRTYFRIEEAGTNLTYEVQNLSEGITYYFAATAYTDNMLESDFSNEYSWNSSNGIPSPPQNFRILSSE